MNVQRRIKWNILEFDDLGFVRSTPALWLRDRSAVDRFDTGFR
jgi:hypothetical protein